MCEMGLPSFKEIDLRNTLAHAYISFQHVDWCFIGYKAPGNAHAPQKYLCVCVKGCIMNVLACKSQFVHHQSACVCLEDSVMYLIARKCQCMQI